MKLIVTLTCQTGLECQGLLRAAAKASLTPTVLVSGRRRGGRTEGTGQSMAKQLGRG